MCRMTDERLDALLSRIGVLDPVATQDALDRQSQLTKPAGSLGVLEQASVQLSGIQGCCPPRAMTRPWSRCSPATTACTPRG